MSNSTMNSHQTNDYQPISLEDELFNGYQKWQQQTQQPQQQFYAFKKENKPKGIGGSYLQSIQKIGGRSQQTPVSRQFNSASNQQKPQQQFENKVILV